MRGDAPSAKITSQLSAKNVEGRAALSIKVAVKVAITKSLVPSVSPVEVAKTVEVAHRSVCGHLRGNGHCSELLPFFSPYI